MKIRYLIIVGLLALVFSLLQLGANRNYAVKSAEAIIAKDQAGEDTTSDIAILKEYVAKHMRANLSFELKAGYDRAVERAREAAEPKIDQSLYTKAQAACAGQRDPVAQTRCVSSYVAANSDTKPRPVVLPSKTKYQFAFTSPAWTPDRAGLAILVSVVLLTLAAWLGLFQLLEKRRD